jgi:tetratricopeptide (TPR) repeat protein
VLDAQPDDYVALSAWGLNELKAGRPEEALDAFLKAGVIEPRYARSWLYSGAAFYQQGETRRALEALARAAELDPLDPMPHVYRSVVLGDELAFGDAIAAAREAQRRMPYLKSLDQAATDQKGQGNLGTAFARFGLQEWANSYANEAATPYWGGSHLFLADRHTSRFAKNSELLAGFLTDPLAFGGSNRRSTLVPGPGHYGRVEFFADRADWSQVAAIGTVNGMVAEPTPLAYYFSGDLARAAAVDDGSRAHGRNFTLGLGVKPRFDWGLFLFATDSRLDAQVRTPALTDDPLAQAESRLDAGIHYALAPENQFWLKAGSGRQSNEVLGAIVSSATANALNRAFGTRSVGAVGSLDRFASAIRQDDVQFRHAFTRDAVRWSWGIERSTQERTGELAMTFAPIGVGIAQLYGVRATDAYASAQWRPSNALGLQLDVFRQSALLQRIDRSVLDAATAPPQRFTLEDAASRQRVTEWNPRVGVEWKPRPGQALRAVVQKWRRPASSASLAPVDTLGVPLGDRLVNAGGDYRRARLQFDGELTDTTFAQAFVDRERADNGLGGRRSAIADFEVTQLEGLRLRQDVFQPRADLEDTPQFAQGRLQSFGVAANHLASRTHSVAARYVWRSAGQEGWAAGLAIPFVPRHFLLLSSQWLMPGRWLVGGHAIYRSERFRDADNLQRMAAGWSAGVMASWESVDKRDQVQAIVDNVLSRSDAGVQRHPHLVFRYARSF